MNVTQDMSVWGLVSHASLFVQLVMLGLLLASLLSWWYIFRKAFVLRQAKSDTEAFEKDFWSGGDLNSLYQAAAAAKHRAGSLERIFEAGFREFSKVKRPPGADRSAAIDGTRRAMSATYQREMDVLEQNLAFLASVGSVAPYIGLLGTVWGIMHAFMGLSTVAQATLSLVAPGIAEALIATAMGLFAAIPAVLAYNRFSHDIDRLAVRFESFMEEFTNIMQRQG
ncbi:MAG: protein TolQ [bacterium]|jgi:biopolymer transport protein TolQ|nr:protein TolQ [Betaproteobacteria bacterium]